MISNVLSDWFEMVKIFVERNPIWCHGKDMLAYIEEVHYSRSSKAELN